MRNMIAVLMLLIPLSVFAADQVEDTLIYNNEKIGVRILQGHIELPADQDYRIQAFSGDAALADLFLVPPPEKIQEMRGRMMGRGMEARMAEQGSYPLHQVHWQIQMYAGDHDGVGPATFEELFGEEDYLKDMLERAPYETAEPIEGPFYFLVPSVPMPAEQPDAEPQVLVMELRPYMDDGKHWVLFTDGNVERREIDAELLKKYELAIRPYLKAGPEEKPQTYIYTILARAQTDNLAGNKQIILRNIGDKSVTVTWNLDKTQPGAEAIMKDWATARIGLWWTMIPKGQSDILRVWAKLSEDLYGAPNFPEAPDFNEMMPGGRGGESTSAFNVLGGQAAIRETLQMQLIGDDDADAGEGIIPIENIDGVQVKAHPYEEMLAGRAGGSLPMAEMIPADRFFIHFAQPRMLLSFFDGGAEFMHDAGGIATRSAIEYNLAERYLGRLGLTEDWARTFIQNGMVSEIAVFLPDLFLIDGTDMTVIARAPNLPMAQAMLRALGINLAEGAVQPVPTKNGSAFWSLSGNLLVMSTHAGELQRTLDLAKAKGEGSLGRSAEFRYMLTKLPVKDTSAAYVYFSDPFIRRLVGPEVKIGQLRRMKALASLKGVTAGALLYLADHSGAEVPALAQLVEMGYVPAALATEDISLRPDLVAVSAAYGTLSDPRTLLANPIARATETEAEAYTQYVGRYSSFWRQFFDPIAIRLDDEGEGRYALETFILPLIDSSIYDAVRMAIRGGEAGPMRTPLFASNPVLMFSVNISDEGWKESSRGLSDMFRQLGLDGRLLDYFGPSVHLAIEDSDPVIAFGSGDLLSAFNNPLPRMGGAEMFMVPVMLSVLTRPSKLAVEVSDPNAVREILMRPIAPRVDRFGGEMQTVLEKIDGRDAWLLSINFFGMVKLSYGVELQENFLVISNLPWVPRSAITSVENSQLNGARIAATPGAVKIQAAALHSAAVDGARDAAMKGIAALYPLLVSVSDNTADASARNAQLFGYSIVHPGSGSFVWEQGQVESSAFGSIRRPTRPPYSPGADSFGLLDNIESGEVQMQLEDEGLRTLLRWKVKME